MVVHEKNLPKIIEATMNLQSWQETAARVRALPLTHGMWLTGEGESAVTNWAHEALQMTAQEYHNLMVASVVSYAERNIADLRVKLNRLGVMTDDPPPSLTPPASVLALTDETAPGKKIPPVPARKKRSRR